MNDETIKLDDTCQYIDRFVLNLPQELLHVVEHIKSIV